MNDNPWLKVPASDYEGHMRSPSVAQLPFLARIFKDSLDKHDCASIALLGCATGNGLEYVDGDATRRVTAIDINSEYLEILRQRHEGRVPGLEIVEADLEICELEDQAYTLIFAGLVFEYLDPRKLLPRIAGGLSPGGVAVSILQLPAERLQKVSRTSFASLEILDSLMKLVSPPEFQAMAIDAGLMESSAKTVTLQTGKAFHVGTYTRV